MSTPPTKILVVRNDKLGDFMLSLPSFALLKRALPDTLIHALLPDYTREIALACPYIDAVIHDPGPAADRPAQLAMRKAIQAQHYDAALTLFSTSRIGWCLWRAGIPYRLAPATKLAQLFYNHHLRQHRSESAKPEYSYNLDLAKKLLFDVGVTAAVDLQPPYLQFAADEVARLKQQFLQQHHIPADHRLLVMHPGSGGSAVNLSLQQYAQLAHALRGAKPFTIVISVGPTERERGTQFAALLGEIPHVLYSSEQGLVMFAKHLQFADLFISGSTGPLHIAGALNRPTVGFYPRRRSATALRWQTLSSDDRRLAFSPPQNSEEESMQGIDLESCAQEILRRLYGEEKIAQ
jgi:ADP-heptose:LPS heptosyltransferase